jgi:hypothetical protein
MLCGGPHGRGKCLCLSYWNYCLYFLGSSFSIPDRLALLLRAHSITKVDAVELQNNPVFICQLLLLLLLLKVQESASY